MEVCSFTCLFYDPGGSAAHLCRASSQSFVCVLDSSDFKRTLLGKSYTFLEEFFFYLNPNHLKHRQTAQMVHRNWCAPYCTIGPRFAFFTNNTFYQLKRKSILHQSNLFHSPNYRTLVGVFVSLLTKLGDFDYNILTNYGR